MKKNVIRLTESQLHEVIKESVKTIISEIGDGKWQKRVAKYLNKVDKEEDPQHCMPVRGKKGQEAYDQIKKDNGGNFPKGIEKHLK